MSGLVCRYSGTLESVRDGKSSAPQDQRTSLLYATRRRDIQAVDDDAARSQGGIGLRHFSPTKSS